MDVNWSWANGSSLCASNPADKSINSGLNSLIFLRTNSYAFRYSSEVVPAGKGILKILLYLPFSFSVPVPG